MFSANKTSQTLKATEKQECLQDWPRPKRCLLWRAWWWMNWGGGSGRWTRKWYVSSEVANQILTNVSRKHNLSFHILCLREVFHLKCLQATSCYTFLFQLPLMCCLGEVMEAITNGVSFFFIPAASSRKFPWKTLSVFFFIFGEHLHLCLHFRNLWKC